MLLLLALLVRNMRYEVERVVIDMWITESGEWGKGIWVVSGGGGWGWGGCIVDGVVVWDGGGEEEESGGWVVGQGIDLGAGFFWFCFRVGDLVF